MNELLKKDITIKTISILFAILLWFLVLDSNNPYSTRTISVTLKVVNENTLESRGIILKNKDYRRSIGIVIKGRKEIINSISVNDFEATLDFSKVKSSSDKTLPINGPYYIGKEEGITIESVSPERIPLDLEKIVKKSFKAEIITTGNMKDNYKVIDTVIMPETFTLQGLDSLIKTVSSVKAVVDITDIDRDFVAITDFKAYSASDKEIPELGRNLSGEVKLVVAKEVPIVPTIKGKPAKNYIYGEKVTSPQTALITGMPEILSKINELSTEAVNIENVNTTVSILRRIRLPEGVKLFNTPTEVEVSVVIEQLSQKDIAITKDDISLQNTLIDNSLGYEMLTHNIVIEIRGNKKELEKINVASLRPSIDVGSLSGGTHSVPLKLTLPDTVKPVGDYSIDIKITGR